MATIIEKLASFFKYFKNYHKHKCKEMGIEDLILRLRIEEDNKLSKMRTNFFGALNKMLLNKW
jgi:hypothetical protein